ncbi:MAG: PQQ-like beta-propeller repeat protein [Myxococcales bacterium]|nr:PQQ-like beta-propeller repeat protein [Myxococcales bacterium]
MRSFEIFVAEDRETEVSPNDTHAAPASGSRPKRRGDGRDAREVLDVFVSGEDADGVRARVGSRHATAALRDLAVAAAALGKRDTGKTLVRFYDEPWELCLERFGDAASLSVYRAGPCPRVTVHDASVPFLDVIDALTAAVSGALAKEGHADALHFDLEQAALALASVDRSPRGTSMQPASVVTVDIDRDAPVALGCDFSVRPSTVPAAPEAARVERTDLHALLFRGRLRAEARGRAVELGEGHPFVFAERFLELAVASLHAWERGREHFVRQEGGGVLVGIRVAEGGTALLTLSAVAIRGDSGKSASYTFPALTVVDIVECAISFGRSLVRGVLRRDRSQCMNLRLGAFRRALRDAEAALREVYRDDMLLNKEPEPYRAFAERSRPAVSTADLAGTRLRYAPRWRALVPGIDLRATFLCGDRIVVGATLETFCLDRASGRILWRVPTVRGTAVVTPGGIARVVADGHIDVHDFGTGEVTLRARIRPRLGGPPAGTVVNAPGLPKLLVVTEGERHLVAIDLASGEPRWRYAWGRGGAPRLRRHGRLLYVASGDSALTAIDVQTGEVVWRVRSRLRFRSAPVLGNEVLFAVAGGMSSLAELWGIDPYSGEVRFRSAIAEGPANVEATPLAAGPLAVCTVRDRYGVRLVAFDRESGATAWRQDSTLAPVGTSWLTVDDLVIGNSPTGELIAVHGETGKIHYRHLLGRVMESDIPRRLEPVLRSGALFVPHTDVHVFRPADGAQLATIGPCDAIPDLLRVDERCDVYVAEESGHVASFAVGPRLSLVR